MMEMYTNFPEEWNVIQKNIYPTVLSNPLYPVPDLSCRTLSFLLLECRCSPLPWMSEGAAELQSEATDSSPLFIGNARFVREGSCSVVSAIGAEAGWVRLRARNMPDRTIKYLQGTANPFLSSRTSKTASIFCLPDSLIQDGGSCLHHPLHFALEHRDSAGKHYMQDCVWLIHGRTLRSTANTCTLNITPTVTERVIILSLQKRIHKTIVSVWMTSKTHKARSPSIRNKFYCMVTITQT